MREPSATSKRPLVTQWTSEGVGNRWSAYEGFDFDGDGIGDTPHRLIGPFERIEGVNPFARLFLQSPAAGALRLIAGTIEDRGLVDDRPLAPQAHHGGGLQLLSSLLGVLAMTIATRGWR